MERLTRVTLVGAFILGVTFRAGIARADYDVGAGQSLTLSTNYSGNVTVGTGASFALNNGAVLSGNVQAGSNSNVTIVGATVSGNVQTTGAASLSITGGTVSGNVQPQNTSTVSIFTSTISGNVQPQGGGPVTVICSTVNGNLQVQRTGATNITSVTVKGDVQVKQTTGGAQVLDCTISGNLQVQQNSGAVTCTGSAVQGNILVQSNTGGATSVSGNTTRQLQCQSNSNLVTCTAVTQVSQTSGSLCSAKTVGGTLSGLLAGTVTLVNNGDSLPSTANGSFTFPTSVAYLGSYSVSVSSQPAGQTCSVANGGGTMGASPVTNVSVVCIPNQYDLGGSLSGLLSGIVVLEDSDGNILTLTAGGSFDFSQLVAFDSSYSVTVIAQPAGQTCSVTNGTGIVGAGNVGAIAVSCVANNYSVGGSVSGLMNHGPLVLSDNAGDSLALGNNGPFTMPSSFAFGSAYSVGVATQPPGQTCTVNPATGVMGAGAVMGITVSCTANSYSVGGSLSGLAEGGELVLTNNGTDVLMAYSSGSFTFDALIPYGGSYDVEILTQAAGQTCTVANGQGTVGPGNVVSVTVTCLLDNYTVGGTLSGLLAGTIGLTYYSQETLYLGSDGPFTFGTPLAYQGIYFVSISQQPEDQSCTLANASGTMGAGNVTNIVVTCAPNLPNAPTNVQASPGNGSATVTWTSPADSLAIGSCLVTACPGGASTSAGGNTALITGLENGQSYTFSVACTNPTGTGSMAFSSPVEASACLGPMPVVCSASDQCHLAGACDAITGTCSNPNKTAGTPCDDQNACTTGESCQVGTCAAAQPAACSGSGASATGTIGAAGGTLTLDTVTLTVGPGALSAAQTITITSTNLSAPTGIVPWSPVYRFEPDGLQFAAPVHVSFVVGTAVSDPVVMWSNTAGGYEDRGGDYQGGQVTAQIVHFSQGFVAQSQCLGQADGTACTDGSACSLADSCQAGLCTSGTPVSCTASDSCHVAGTCDPTSGACGNPAAADGTPCDAGDACTQTGTCVAGTCTGAGPVTCESGFTCTGSPGACTPVCGDGIIVGGEQCDDGNTLDGDGCSSSCTIEAGFTCIEEPSECGHNDCPAGWHNLVIGCYKAFLVVSTWDAAQSSCAASYSGAHLPIIQGDLDNGLLWTWAATQNISGPLMLDFFDTVSAPNDYAWLHAYPSSVYTNWAPGEPRIGAAYAAISLDGSTVLGGTWSAVPLTQSINGFVCEYY